MHIKQKGVILEAILGPAICIAFGYFLWAVSMDLSYILACVSARQLGGGALSTHFILKVENFAPGKTLVEYSAPSPPPIGNHRLG